jgi:hypothetical protein
VLLPRPRKEDVLSSASQHQHHLTSVDMGMIMRALMSARAKNRIVPGSLDAKHLAALLVREFQYGVCCEADLLAAFRAAGVLQPSVPVGRLDQFIGNALHSGKPTAAPFPIDYPSSVRGTSRMRYLARLNADPTAWLLILLIGSVVGTLLYVVLTSITF